MDFFKKNSVTIVVAAATALFVAVPAAKPIVCGLGMVIGG